MISCRFSYLLTFTQLKVISSAKSFSTFPFSIPLNPYNVHIVFVLPLFGFIIYLPYITFPSWHSVNSLRSGFLSSFFFKSQHFSSWMRSWPAYLMKKHLNSAHLLGEFQNVASWGKTADVIGGLMNANYCLKEVSFKSCLKKDVLRFDYWGNVAKSPRRIIWDWTKEPFKLREENIMGFREVWGVFG